MAYKDSVTPLHLLWILRFRIWRIRRKKKTNDRIESFNIFRIFWRIEESYFLFFFYETETTKQKRNKIYRLFKLKRKGFVEVSSKQIKILRKRSGVFVSQKLQILVYTSCLKQKIGFKIKQLEYNNE